MRDPNRDRNPEDQPLGWSDSPRQPPTEAPPTVTQPTTPPPVAEPTPDPQPSTDQHACDRDDCGYRGPKPSGGGCGRGIFLLAVFIAIDAFIWYPFDTSFSVIAFIAGAVFSIVIVGMIVGFGGASDRCPACKQGTLKPVSANPVNFERHDLPSIAERHDVSPKRDEKPSDNDRKDSPY